MKAILILALVAVTTALPRTVNLNRPSLETKIIGGEDAGDKEFPFYVVLKYRVPWEGLIPYCSAVIYDETRIITTGVCATKSKIVPIIVTAGSNNIAVPTGEEQTRHVVDAIFHENFSDQTFENDIAILILDSPLVYTARVQPARLALSSSVTTGEVVTCGHGSTLEQGNDYSYKLQKATLKTISRDECTHEFESIVNAPAITNTMVCASSVKKGFCYGDTGGPLIAKDEARREYVAGVSSFGVVPCGDYPSVFTDIAPLRSWLDSKLT